MTSTKPSTGRATRSIAKPASTSALLGTGLCRPKHACVNDRYARRIDRFFNWNPALANAYVAHPHFEVRAIAAKHASVFLLPPLLDDPEETVRWNAARRLPKRLCSGCATTSIARCASASSPCSTMPI